MEYTIERIEVKENTVHLPHDCKILEFTGNWDEERGYIEIIRYLRPV